MAQGNPEIIEDFGPFQLIRSIGSGGMAEVFLARDSEAASNAPPVVVKRLHKELEKDTTAVDLFITEADVMMLLDHPNIVKVYNAGEINNRYFMAMEYIHGTDVAQIAHRYRQKNLPLSVECACSLMIPVLRALAYAHNTCSKSGKHLGIVHRDVTPSNLFISLNGEIKLGDFGVAKLLGIERWTMMGSLKGKLRYLSPEQVVGNPPEPSFDLWAASISLYELLAGHKVFLGENELETMLQIKGVKIPKLRKVNKEIPKELGAIIQKSLHKKPSKRYPTAIELLEELESFLGSRLLKDQALVDAIRAPL